ncbi:MAG: hypothetical protein JNK05_06735 [Myxococcales bacterium]|nr:hypothetical protein [Myxococcales bacterium]
MNRSLASWVPLVALVLVACAEEVSRQDASRPDASDDTLARDASAADSGVDATSSDSGASDDATVTDSGVAPTDTGVDASASDSGADTGIDAGVDSGVDSGVDAGNDTGIRDTGADTGIRDTGSDTGIRDTGVATGGCISGATGNYVARFRWTGTPPMSRANVSYEANTLPDRARWRVTAANRGPIGSYTPTFTDTFLGEGGLDFGGTTFMDVELSTAGIGSISSVTIAIYGRSFNTTASGSYSWMTFQGSGAAPSGLVSNVAPYRWYQADATSAIRPGISNMLLRISPGPPSGSLVVSRVEICIDGR